MITTIKDNIHRLWHEASEEVAIYFLSAASLLIIWLMTLLFPNRIPESAFYFPWVLISIGFTVFFYQLTSKIWGTVLAKIALSIFVIAISTASLGMAKQVININFEVPTAAFPMSYSLLSALLTPLVCTMVIGGMGLVAVSIGVVLIFSPFDISKITAKKILTLTVPRLDLTASWFFKSLTRYIAMGIIVSFCFMLLENNDWYSKWALGMAKSFAYHWEAEKLSYCKLNEGEKLTYLEGDIIVVSSYEKKDDSYTFRVDKCISTIN